MERNVKPFVTSRVFRSYLAMAFWAFRIEVPCWAMLEG